MLFGQTSTHMYRWLKLDKMSLLTRLIRDEVANVQVPSTEEIRLFSDAISKKYLVLENVWGTVDG